MFLTSLDFALFYCFSLSVFRVASWGPARLGAVSGLRWVGGGDVPWTVLAWVAGGLCTLVNGPLSARVGVVSLAALPAALDRDLSQCGWHPNVASSSPHVSVPGHVSLVTASVCVRVSVCVCVCVRACMRVCVGVFI